MYYRDLRKKREKGAENVLEERIAKNLNLGRKTEIHFPEAQRSPNKLNPRRPTIRHIVIKIAKKKSFWDKERIVKVARGKRTVIQKGNSFKGMRVFFSRNFPGRKEII